MSGSTILHSQDSLKELASLRSLVQKQEAELRSLRANDPQDLKSIIRALTAENNALKSRVRTANEDENLTNLKHQARMLDNSNVGLSRQIVELKSKLRDVAPMNDLAAANLEIETLTAKLHAAEEQIQSLSANLSRPPSGPPHFQRTGGAVASTTSLRGTVVASPGPTVSATGAHVSPGGADIASFVNARPVPRPHPTTMCPNCGFLSDAVAEGGEAEEGGEDGEAEAPPVEMTLEELEKAQREAAEAAAAALEAERSRAHAAAIDILTKHGVPNVTGAVRIVRGGVIAAEEASALHRAAEAGHAAACTALLLSGEDADEVAGAQRVTALMVGAASNAVGAMRALLEGAACGSGASVGAVDSRGATALHYAARAGAVDAVNALLCDGADPLALDMNGGGAWSTVPPGNDALRKRLLDAAEVTVLAESGLALPRSAVRAGWTAAHAAAREGHASAISLLGQLGARLDECDVDGTRPLYIAASRGHTETVAALLKGLKAQAEARTRGDEGEGGGLALSAKDSINAAIPRGFTALHAAAYHGHLGAVKALVEGGADVTAVAGMRTAYNLAASAGRHEVCNYLRQHEEAKHAAKNAHSSAGPGDSGGAEASDSPEGGDAIGVDAIAAQHGITIPRTKAATGWSALHAAAAAGNLACVRALLAHADATGGAGAVISSASEGHLGMTPLHVAAAGGYSEVVEALVGAGALAAARNASKQTPLHLAAAAGSVDTVEAILRARDVDAQAADSYGRTAADVAKGAEVKKRLIDVALDSLAAGGGFTLVAEDEGSHIHAAVRTTQPPEMLAALLACGADIEAHNALSIPPLHAAVQSGHGATVDALLSLGAAPNSTTAGGVTALHRAAFFGRADLCKRLLECGASIARKVDDGEMAADIAAACGHAPLAAVLAPTGAPPPGSPSLVAALEAADGEGTAPMAGVLLLHRLRLRPLPVAVSAALPLGVTAAVPSAAPRRPPRASAPQTPLDPPAQPATAPLPTTGRPPPGVPTIACGTCKGTGRVVRTSSVTDRSRDAICTTCGGGGVVADTAAPSSATAGAAQAVAGGAAVQAAAPTPPPAPTAPAAPVVQGAALPAPDAGVEPCAACSGAGTVSKRSALTGKVKDQPCSECGGKGHKVLAPEGACGECKGAGIVSKRSALTGKVRDVPCPTCGGKVGGGAAGADGAAAEDSAPLPPNACKSCNGQGKIEKKHRITKQVVSEECFLCGGKGVLK